MRRREARRQWQHVRLAARDLRIDGHLEAATGRRSMLPGVDAPGGGLNAVVGQRRGNTVLAEGHPVGA